jgi:amino acid adenylation domain-containing protein
VIEDIYPLSPTQQGMLFHSVYASESAMYLEQRSCVLRGELDVRALEGAWQGVIDRYAVLRSSFAWEELNEPVQVVERQVTMPFTVLDWRAFSPEEQSTRLNEFLAADRAAGFNLLEAPLMRVTLMQMGTGRHHLVWSHHHLLMDGWSQPLLLRDVFTLYEAHTKGEPAHLPPVRPFRDYIAWLQCQDMTQAERFWREYLRGFTAATPLPLARASSQTSVKSSGHVHFERRTHLTRDVTEKLVKFSRSYQVTLNTVMQGAWAILLSRYSGERDVVFGATVSGRPPDLEGVERMIGIFINTLPVRANAGIDEPVGQWLRSLQDHQAEARQFEFTPLADVQRWSEADKSQSLFEAILVFDNYPVNIASRNGGGASVEVLDISSFKLTNYPLTLVASPGREFELLMCYDQFIFDDESIDQMLRHLMVLLKAIAENPEQKLSELSMLTAEERHQLLVTFNDTKRDYPSNCSIHQLFEQQVRRTPKSAAVICEDKQLTYAELNAKANQLAHYLRGQGVGPEVKVAILLERSPELVVSLLAVLKAGGVYVPLDPAYPLERLRFMLADSDAVVLLTQESLFDALPAHRAQEVCLDLQDAEIAAQSTAEPAVSLDPANLCYILYTSGSTGKPKGVQITHGGLSNYLNWALSVYPVHEGGGAPVHSPICFDLTVTSLFLPLLAGRSVTLLPEGHGIEPLAALLREPGGFSLIKLTPAHLEMLRQCLPAETAAQAARMLVLGGEGLWGEELTFWRAHAPVTRVVNEYGPTETVVGCCVYEVLAGEVKPGAVPIGRPVANTRLYVLGRCGEPVPVGVIGELYIGGLQVGRGYLKQAGLTADRFVPDSLSGQAGERLYCTGDLVRRLENGQLEFVGRVDQQIKLRGYRIELGEIESVLAQHPQVSDCVVMLRADTPGNPRLAAYLVAELQPSNADLLRFLQERLPDYMVPSVFVFMDDLPLTPNGKVDREALPAPDRSRPELDDSFAAPTNPLEEDLARMWKELLGVERIGINDNFLELGGHSLMVMQIVSRVRADYGLEIPLPEIFRTPTIKRLAVMIEEAFLASPEADNISEMLAQVEIIDSPTQAAKQAKA